jgi:hypothetical protein
VGEAAERAAAAKGLGPAMSLLYADRCERYARQRGWAYDEHRMSWEHLTPAQRRRALKKEGHLIRRHERQAQREGIPPA